MVLSCVIGRRNAAWTDCRGVKGCLSHALSGWSLAGTCSTERKKRANCSSACSRCETTWDFSPRSTIRARNDNWEISRRHFPMLPCLPPRESLTVNRKLRHRNDTKERRSLVRRTQERRVGKCASLKHDDFK